MRRIVEKNQLYCCVVSDDKKYTACLVKNELSLYKTSGFEPVSSASVGHAYNIAFSQDGTRLFVLKDRRIVTFSVGEELAKTGEVRLHYREFDLYVPVGNCIYTCVRIPNRDVYKLVRVSDFIAETVFEFSDERKIIDIEFYDGSLYFCGVKDTKIVVGSISVSGSLIREEVFESPIDSRRISDMIYSPERGYLMLLSPSLVRLLYNDVCAYDTDGTELQRVFNTERGIYTGMCFAGKSREFAVLHGLEKLTVVSSQNGKTVFDEALPFIQSVIVSGGGDCIFASNGERGFLFKTETEQ